MKKTWFQQFRGRFQPALFTRRGEPYGRAAFLRDMLSGLIVGIVAVPLAIAFAIASGVDPAKGLVTGVVAGFLISFFGGSRFQIGGPTGAFIVIVYGIVQTHGYTGLAVATVMAGVMLIALGLAGAGNVIKFIPYPVTVGFTSGIALIIFTGQVRDMLGLSMETLPAEFIERCVAYWHHISSVNPVTCALTALTIVIIVGWKRVSRRIPGSLVALLAVTALVQVFGLDARFGVETIGGRFPEIAGGVAFTLPEWPSLGIGQLRALISSAITIALLASIESLLSAVVADGMTATRHNSNTELIAQGIANIASPLCGGIPATGAIARTATNIKNGAVSPVSGLVHALFMLLVMLCLGRWVALVPMAALAGIVAIVAFSMSEWRLFLKICKSTHSDMCVLFATFGLTVLVDLTVAIEAGMILAAALFIRRVADTAKAGYVTRLIEGFKDGGQEADDTMSLKTRAVPEGVEVFEVKGPMFFGAAEFFKEALSEINYRPRVLIIRMRQAYSLDATALNALEQIHADSRREGTRLVLSGVHPQPRAVMERSGLVAALGAENVCDNIDVALARAGALLAAD